MQLLVGCLVWMTSLLITCNADIYLHNPRGSNNRLNEARATRQTNNRVFDSQNNARGGYNIGDKTDKKAGNNVDNQYHMEYFMSGSGADDVTELLIEWTNQHGCGGNEDNDPSKLNCNIVIQYMDQSEPPESGKDVMRDGTITNIQPYNNIPGETNRNNIRKFYESQSRYVSRKQGNVQLNRAYHEPHEWYDSCRARYRNKGLFTADQNISQDRATHTRQNANGNRNGYECPEERDYYPYFHPTPWKDIMVYTKAAKNCDYYKKESFNVKPKHECVEKWPGSQNDRHYSSANTKELCDRVGGAWVEFWNYLEIYEKASSEEACNAVKITGHRLKWAIPYRLTGDSRLEPACLVLLKAPDCAAAPFSRQNHLGNGDNLQPLRYKWNLPNFPSKDKKLFVLRIRYNISTDDFDPFNTFSDSNNDPKSCKRSPVQTNPLLDIGASNPVKLAINTAQFGRTFQDRTHTGYIIPREINMKGRIVNLNVRGKRGNIVQTFPAVEYDFVPKVLNLKATDLMHIQWTGSNSHNNRAPGGDGQTGDAGQGTAGTDRSNIVGLGSPDRNFPLTMENQNNICHHMEVVWERSPGTSNPKWYDICLKLGSAGYYDCKNGCTNALDTKTKMNNLLNNAPASFSGMLVRMKTRGTYHYTCTRNNAFTNRSQKGKIIVQ